MAVLFMPLLFGNRKLKGDMVVGGSNSLVISAACHVLPRKHSQRVPNKRSVPHAALSNTESNAGRSMETLYKLVESKIRRGAVSLPQDLADQMQIDDVQDVLHLSFGGEEDDVREPQDGKYYV